jgi:small conductance mechanosensitive channel
MPPPAFQQVPALPRQVAPDSLALDSPALRDSLDAFGNLSRDVGETGRLILEGKWELVWAQVYRGFADIAVAFVPNLISAVFVFLIFYFLYRTFGSLLGRVLSRSRTIDPGIRSLLMKSYRVFGLAFIFVMVLANFDINVTALLAGFSIVGVAVGFAAKDTLENFISGVTILLDRPFRVGDAIDIEGVYGTVEEITLRSTRIRTLNNAIMVMPNIQMINQRLVNHTMRGVLRVEIPFGIAYKEHPQAAREVVLKTAEGDPRLRPDLPPSVVVTKLNESSVDMALYLFLKDPKQEVPVRFEYVERVREALRRAGIEIPYPHRQLFIDEAKAFEKLRLPPPSTGAAPDAPTPPSPPPSA